MFYEISLSAYNVKTTLIQKGELIMTATLSTKQKSKTSHGKVFEKEFLNSFPDNLFIQRVKDDTLKFKNVQNCCDFIAYNSPYLFLFELKSTKQKSLPFSNISKYQVDTLYHYNNQAGIKHTLFPLTKSMTITIIPLTAAKVFLSCGYKKTASFYPKL